MIKVNEAMNYRFGNNEVIIFYVHTFEVKSLNV